MSSQTSGSNPPVRATRANIKARTGRASNSKHLPQEACTKYIVCLGRCLSVYRNHAYASNLLYMLFGGTAPSINLSPSLFVSFPS